MAHVSSMLQRLALRVAGSAAFGHGTSMAMAARQDTAGTSKKHTMSPQDAFRPNYVQLGSRLSLPKNLQNSGCSPSLSPQQLGELISALLRLFVTKNETCSICTANASVDTSTNGTIEALELLPCLQHILQCSIAAFLSGWKYHSKISVCRELDNKHREASEPQV